MKSSWRPDGATKARQTITADWQFTTQQLIAGVAVKEVKNVPTGYGFLTEIFREEWGLDSLPVGQVFQAVLRPGGISAWHAHECTTDRLFVNTGLVHIVLYDGREFSPTCGTINEFRLGSLRPALIVVPPKVWHGIHNISDETSSTLNLVDRAYRYEDPDHWRLPPDSPQIPYRFSSV
jgi:dTDP-4-dehydrorhamnose 3,5-epimerase